MGGEEHRRSPSCGLLGQVVLGNCPYLKLHCACQEGVRAINKKVQRGKAKWPHLTTGRCL